MEKNKPFFLFVAILAVICIGFGVYVATLKSCSDPGNALPVLECHKLYLAFGVLFAVAIMLALGAGFYALLDPGSENSDHPGKQIFDTLAKSLVPVITLVLGYYFGSAQVSSKSAPTGEPAALDVRAAVPGASAAASTPLGKK